MKTPIFIAGMLCAFVLGAATMSFAGGAAPPVYFHLDASPTIQSAAGSTAYSDTVEETREENVLRILGVALAYYLIRNNQLRHKLAAQHAPDRPCAEPAAQPASAASPLPAPTLAPSTR